MKKILVLGSGGSGKSTFAVRLGAARGLEVIHLDARYWLPGWVEPTKEAWIETVDRALAGEAWVMDGNYSGTLERRLAACDTVVLLDLPRWLCLLRVVRRTLAWRGRARPDMASGCPERFEPKFLLWVWNYGSRSRVRILEMLGRLAADKVVVRLRSRAEVARFLAQA
ncbi:MAG TPA: hypothetical protein VLC09_16615 [Polyangiaceae bacterium]|nr:hypothetical protein [Polyangiaceae bacterium]